MRLVKSATFLAIAVVMFFIYQEILTPNWSCGWGGDVEPVIAGTTIRGIKTLEADSIDVLFLGTSHVVYTVSPIDLWANTGIWSYNLATQGQPAAQSYFFLQEAFENQHPKVVVWDVLSLFYEETADSQWRYGLDGMKLGVRKAEMSLAYEQSVEGANIWDALFPLFRYHTRWSQLKEEDFQVIPKEDYYSAGFLMTCRVTPTQTKASDIDVVEESLQAMGPGTEKHIENSVEGESYFSSSPYSVQFNDHSLSYFLKIKEFCEENGAQLLLVKIPSLRFPQMVNRAWTKQKYLFTRSLAEKYDVPFFDLTYDNDTGIDYTTDSVDGGVHLNIRGSQKVTNAIGNYLLQNFRFEKRDASWDSRALAKYAQVKNAALLESETSFDDYMERLEKNKDKWTILITAQDDYVSGLSQSSYERFNALGLQMISNGSFGNSYAAMLENGVVRYEALSDRRIDYSMDLDGISATVSSSGWYTGANSAISINGRAYGTNGRGLNFVVYDNESHQVIDSVCFDTWQENKPVSRNGSAVDSYLRAYERSVR